MVERARSLADWPLAVTPAKRMVRVWLRSHTFDFRDGNHGQESDEQKEHGEEQTECPDVGSNVNPGGTIVTPTARQEIAVQADHADDESFEPHSDVDQAGDDEHNHQVEPQPAEPE